MAVFQPAAMIETVSGALTKPKKNGSHKHGSYVIATHRKAATQNPNCQRIYLNKADRFDRTTPLKQKEVAARQRFQAVRAMVKTRKEDLTKITADQTAFLAQKDLANGKRTMNAYLWKVCGLEYDEAQD